MLSLFNSGKFIIERVHPCNYICLQCNHNVLINYAYVCLRVTECLDLGKKISVPQDVMMEELTLLSNKGSRMFQQRQKRVEKFTLEGAGKQADNVSQRCSVSLSHTYVMQTMN